ncbi:hypothetical protein P8452_36704 [Trifolium repens]|nr:hypothetical protein P8452_36704 [Trifolium repens]
MLVNQELLNEGRKTDFCFPARGSERIPEWPVAATNTIGRTDPTTPSPHYNHLKPPLKISRPAPEHCTSAATTTVAQHFTTIPPTPHHLQVTTTAITSKPPVPPNNQPAATYRSGIRRYEQKPIAHEATGTTTVARNRTISGKHQNRTRAGKTKPPPSPET